MAAEQQADSSRLLSVFRAPGALLRSAQAIHIAGQNIKIGGIHPEAL
jgi:hypothetical protein